VGAGWQEREHTAFGFDLLNVTERMDRFEEGLEVMSRLLRSDMPVSYEGRYFKLHEAVLLPRPQRPGGPRLLIGGNGPQRTLPLVARYADEWNAVYIPPARFLELSSRLDSLLAEQDRPASAVRRSLMTGLVFGRDEAELSAKLQGRDPASLRERGVIVGVPGAVQEQLHTLAQAGVQRVMVQWLALDDLDGLEALAKAVL
jgi:alkanesulfonate monooxygenase SsuD/methylene tetrahydromethanopterin reductase-like flavin-dependent oxidoreductase (luciferase family)